MCSPDDDEDRPLIQHLTRGPGSARRVGARPAEPRGRVRGHEQLTGGQGHPVPAAPVPTAEERGEPALRPASLLRSSSLADVCPTPFRAGPRSRPRGHVHARCRASTTAEGARGTSTRCQLLAGKGPWNLGDGGSLSAAGTYHQGDARVPAPTGCCGCRGHRPRGLPRGPYGQADAPKEEVAAQSHTRRPRWPPCGRPGPPVNYTQTADGCWAP